MDSTSFMAGRTGRGEQAAEPASLWGPWCGWRAPSRRDFLQVLIGLHVFWEMNGSVNRSVGCS